VVTTARVSADSPPAQSQTNVTDQSHPTRPLFVTRGGYSPDRHATMKHSATRTCSTQRIRRQRRRTLVGHAGVRCAGDRRRGALSTNVTVTPGYNIINDHPALAEGQGICDKITQAMADARATSKSSSAPLTSTRRLLFSQSHGKSAAPTGLAVEHLGGRLSGTRRLSAGPTVAIDVGFPDEHTPRRAATTAWTLRSS